MKLRFANTFDLNDFRLFCRQADTAGQIYRPAIGDFSLVNLFVNFGSSKPDAWDIFIIDASKQNTATVIASSSFLIGYNGDYWFGVFKKLTGAFSYRTFVFAVRTSNGTYFSDIYENCDCDELMHLSVCYPFNYNAEDMNGIFIGSPDMNFPVMGGNAIRYTHHAWVRQGEIVETVNRMSFVASRFRNFRTELVKQFELRGESVPAWYKDELAAIFFRGNIVIDGKERRVSDINFEDLENGRWKAYAILESDYKGSFGCSVVDCKNGDGGDCDSPEIEDVPLGPFRTYRHYLQFITVSGTNPTVQFAQIPDWMNASYSAGVITLSSFPEDAGLYDLEIIVTNACGYDIRSEEIEVVYEPCQEIDLSSVPPTLPAAIIGENYFVSYPLGGTEPYDLNVTTKPAWMTIGTAGGTVYFTGIPSSSSDWVNVNFTIKNCGDEFEKTYNGYVKVWGKCEEYYNNTSEVHLVSFEKCHESEMRYNVPIWPGESICVNPGSLAGTGAGYLIKLGQCY